MGNNKSGGKNQIGLPARRASVRFLKKILRDKNSLDDLFSHQEDAGPLQSFTTRDRALVRQIVTTVLRRHGQLSSRINKHLEKPLPRKSGDAWEILLCGAAQILFMNVPTHAAIDLSVRLASYDRNAKHFKGLINAVLRRVSENTDMAEERYRENIPGWLLEIWQKQYSEDEIDAIAKQHILTPVLDITPKEEAVKWAEKLNAEILPSGSLRIASDGQNRGRIDKLPGFKRGAWWVQDIAATIPVKLLDDIKGKHVLDLCAAPGGKTLQLANAGALVTSVDQSENRLKLLRDNLKRTGLKANIVCDDATKFYPDTLPDFILLDAPCSATGTIRRHPDLPVLKNEESIIALHNVQQKLIAHAANILKPGGSLIYCTCSLDRREGEDQIKELLANNHEFIIDPIQASDVWDLTHALTEEGFMRTLPFYYGEKGGMDGFFIARLKKSTL